MTVQERVNEHRKRLRAQGYRPVQIWLPDVRSAWFAAEAQRQARVVAAHDDQHDDQDFIEAVSVDWGEE